MGAALGLCFFRFAGMDGEWIAFGGRQVRFSFFLFYLLSNIIFPPISFCPDKITFDEAQKPVEPKEKTAGLVPRLKFSAPPEAVRNASPCLTQTIRSSRILTARRPNSRRGRKFLNAAPLNGRGSLHDSWLIAA